MLKKTLFSFILTMGFSLLMAQNITISGAITEQATGETLIGASVIISELALGTTSNEYGFYSITVPKGESLDIQFSYIGFQPIVQKISTDVSQTINIELGAGVNLQEVVVKANSYEEQLNSTEMSVATITTKEAKLLPVLMGESDILKTVQLKPGIPSGAEGTTGLFVRGGSSDQNLIVLDEAIVYNANHLFGFFSTFNTDAVKDLKIYKGGFPSKYGGRLSSVIDVKLKEGNNKKFTGTGGIGLISSRLTLEGPIQKGKSSFMVSGRRTYIDLITSQVNKANEGKEDYNQIPDYYFYDLNTKINFTLGEKDKIFLSGYFGRDVFGFDSDFFDFNFNWGNATGTARWNHVFNPKLFANTTFTYSDYQYNIVNKITGFSFDVGSDIKDANLKSDFYYVVNNKHVLRFGGAVTYHQFGVGRLKAGSDDGEISFEAGTEYDALEGGVYISDDWEISSKSKMSAGLRLSGFNNDGAFYAGLEPRLAFRQRLTERMALKTSYARMKQYVHLVASAGSSLPTDVWYPSTANVEPQNSDQVAVGLSYLFNKGIFMSVEGYYKWLGNQVDFVDGADLFANDDLEEEFAIGKGRGYGFEVSLEKKEGRLTGWIGYTLALIEKGDFVTLNPTGSFQQEGYFSPIYDRRHDLSVVAIYELSKRLTLSATYVYGSGDLRWMAPGRFSFQDVYGYPFQAIVPDYTDRNNYRLPYYSRLDLGLVIKFFPKWGESDLSINVVNALDRRNAFFLYLEPEFKEVEAGGNVIQIPDRIAAKQVSLFPVLPSVSWSFKF
jgi:hypothetical protein